MKKLIVVLIALLVLPSITLAGKGGNKPPPDTALQDQVNENTQNITTNTNDINNNVIGIADNTANIQTNSDAITAEETARQGGDAALQSQIDTLQGLITDIYNSNKFGNILVYDANDQFLGILLSADPHDHVGGYVNVAEIFIPSLNVATIILEDLTPTGLPAGTGTGPSRH